ncbi:MAG: EF-hand domain-containing protein [Ekhidna sp.]
MSTDFQRKKLAYFFKILDLNSNGILQLNDFSEMAEKVRIQMNYEDNSREHKKIVDKSVKLFHTLQNDISPKEYQEISEDEWASFFVRELVESGDEDQVDDYKELIFNFMFDFFDQNKDGFISKSEYADFYTIFGIDTQYLDKAFSQLDATQDGRLSRYEMMSAIEDFLTSDDTTLKGNWIFGNWDSNPHAGDEF